MLVVLIAHVDVVHVVNTVFVAIFRSHFSVVGDVRLMPQVNRPLTDFRRFPRSISVKSIVVVMSQMRDATRKFAIATTRRSFATNFGRTLYPPLP